MNMKLNILLSAADFFPNENNKNYTMMNSVEQYIEYFMLPQFSYNFSNEKADITIHGVQSGSTEFKNNTINMLISVENMNRWNHYSHYNKYGNYNNKDMHIYLYNHITKLIKTEEYIAIPMILCRINYYMINCNKIQPSIVTSFNDKKFCLMINKSKLNCEINIISSWLSNIGIVDNISMYDDIIKTESCYNSIILLNVFNKYKFIICFENSYDDGYITEKIFNCFFAKTIPIYMGSPIVEKYLNTDSFIDGRKIDQLIQTISMLNCNETIYNDMVESSKISSSYDDMNYKKELEEFIIKKKY